MASQMSSTESPVGPLRIHGMGAGPVTFVVICISHDGFSRRKRPMMRSVSPLLCGAHGDGYISAVSSRWMLHSWYATAMSLCAACS